LHAQVRRLRFSKATAIEERVREERCRRALILGLDGGLALENLSRHLDHTVELLEREQVFSRFREHAPGFGMLRSYSAGSTASGYSAIA